jgi:hypothetical protein
LPRFASWTVGFNGLPAPGIGIVPVPVYSLVGRVGLVMT